MSRGLIAGVVVLAMLVALLSVVGCKRPEEPVGNIGGPPTQEMMNVGVEEAPEEVPEEVEEPIVPEEAPEGEEAEPLEAPEGT